MCVLGKLGINFTTEISLGLPSLEYELILANERERRTEMGGGGMGMSDVYKKISRKF